MNSSTVIAFPVRDAVARQFANVDGALFREVRDFVEALTIFFETDIAIAGIARNRTCCERISYGAARVRLATRGLDIAAVMATGRAWVDGEICGKEATARLALARVDPADVWWDDSMPVEFVVMCRQSADLARRVVYARERLERAIEEGTAA